ncbi:putative scorpion long chain toxin/defensin, knottin, scorpion toxin [Arabidopsis thaliana]
MTTKSVSIFAFFFILVLVIFEIPEIEAQHDECLEEYGRDAGPALCAPEIVPTICYIKCRTEKEANGGRCLWGKDGNAICLCEYCNEERSNQFTSLT